MSIFSLIAGRTFNIAVEFTDILSNVCRRMGYDSMQNCVSA